MKREHKIIFKTVVGSQAYGTATPASDQDFKGVYIQHPDDILGFNYLEQFEVSKDECYYEVRRFLQLLQSANPTVLEMLFMPEECVLETSSVFDLIVQNRDKFLTKKCLHSFGGYAIAQIKKAKGLDKKMNWERERVARKTPFDFCFVYENGKTLSLEQFLNRENIKQENCGLVNLNHFKDCYALYFHPQNGFYNGIVSENSNEVKLSSVPKNESPLTMMYFNKDGYSMHCKDYREYTEWLAKRNTQRYVDIKGHNQQIDGKNLLHCRRLLDMALEIATEKKLIVKRPNADYLLQIRRGEVDLETIINDAEKDIKKLEEAYSQSDLPDEVDKDFVNDLLLKIRKKAEKKIHTFTESFEKYLVQDESLPHCVLVDIDGTVAKMQNRYAYDWHRVGEDIPKTDVIRLVKTLKNAGDEIIFFSGRDEVCREESKAWICENFNWEASEYQLFMRKSNDQKKDADIKLELFNVHIRDKYYVELVIDDRQQVVDMWRRKLGLTCVQVDYGDF